jgi:uncharacterized membrane protein YraQ (UPF0718 family)
MPKGLAGVRVVQGLTMSSVSGILVATLVFSSPTGCCRWVPVLATRMVEMGVYLAWLATFLRTPGCETAWTAWRGMTWYRRLALLCCAQCRPG